MGLVSGCDINVTFTGDESLNSRPMKKVLIPLLQSGAEISSNNDKLPITIKVTKYLSLSNTALHSLQRRLNRVCF